MIDQAFWSDPDIEASKAGVKLAALWLITNSQTNLLGICGASEARFKFETGLPIDALERALEALPRAFKRFGGLVFVRNYIRHQYGTGERLTRNNFFVSLRSLYLSVKDEGLREAIEAEYPEFSHPYEPQARRASEGLTKPKGREEKGSTGQKGSPEGKPKGPKLPRPETPEGAIVCRLFGRRPETAWAAKEVKSFDAAVAHGLSIETLAVIEPYYTSERAKNGEGQHRRDLYTFLNNFAGELDRASAFQLNPKAHEKRTATHPGGTSDRNVGHNANVAGDYAHRPSRTPQESGGGGE